MEDNGYLLSKDGWLYQGNPMPIFKHGIDQKLPNKYGNSNWDYFHNETSSFINFDENGQFATIYYSYGFIEVWDIRSTPVLLKTFRSYAYNLENQLISTTKKDSICMTMSLSSNAKYLAGVFGKKNRGISDIVIYRYLLIWDVFSDELVECLRIPFPCNCINFLDESKGLLLLGASDVDTIVLVNWKIGRLNVMNNQISSQVLEFSIKLEKYRSNFMRENMNITNEFIVSDANEVIEFWKSTHPQVPSKLSSSIVLMNICSTLNTLYVVCNNKHQYSVNSWQYSIQDNIVTFEICHQIAISSFPRPKVDDEIWKPLSMILSNNKNHLLITGDNGSIYCLDSKTMQIITCFHTADISQSLTIRLIGADFFNNYSSNNNHMIAFACKYGNDISTNRLVFWDFICDMNVIEANIIKSCYCIIPRPGLTSLKCHPSLPIIFGIDKTWNKISIYNPKPTSNFAGPQYPVGFELIEEVVTYFETEDELDKNPKKKLKEDDYQRLSMPIDIRLNSKDKSYNITRIPLHISIANMNELKQAKAQDQKVELQFIQPITTTSTTPLMNPLERSPNTRRLDEHEDFKELPVLVEEHGYDLSDFLPIPRRIKSKQFIENLQKEYQIHTRINNLLDNEAYIRLKFDIMKQEAVENHRKYNQRLLRNREKTKLRKEQEKLRQESIALVNDDGIDSNLNLNQELESQLNVNVNANANVIDINLDDVTLIPDLLTIEDISNPQTLDMNDKTSEMKDINVVSNEIV